MIHNDPLKYHFSQILVYHELSKSNDRKCIQTTNRSAIQVAHRKTVSFCLMIDRKVLTDPKHRMTKKHIKNRSKHSQQACTRCKLGFVFPSYHHKLRHYDQWVCSWYRNCKIIFLIFTIGQRLEPLYGPIRQKLASALTNWHPSDPSAKVIIEPWVKVSG